MQLPKVKPRIPEDDVFTIKGISPAKWLETEKCPNFKRIQDAFDSNGFNEAELNYCFRRLSNPLGFILFTYLLMYLLPFPLAD